MRYSCRSREVDPIVWTEIEPSLATHMQIVLTRTTGLLLLPKRTRRIDATPGETEVGSAGEQPAKG